MHTPRHTRKTSSFSTQDEHLVLLGLEALTEAPNLYYATRSNYRLGDEEAQLLKSAVLQLDVRELVKDSPQEPHNQRLHYSLERA